MNRQQAQAQVQAQNHFNRLLEARWDRIKSEEQEFMTNLAERPKLAMKLYGNAPIERALLSERLRDLAILTNEATPDWVAELRRFQEILLEEIRNERPDRLFGFEMEIENSERALRRWLLDIVCDTLDRLD